LLNNDFEVLEFVNPGAGMKYIKDTSRVKVQQLTKKDVGYETSIRICNKCKPHQRNPGKCTA